MLYLTEFKYDDGVKVVRKEAYIIHDMELSDEEIIQMLKEKFEKSSEDYIHDFKIKRSFAKRAIFEGRTISCY